METQRDALIRTLAEIIEPDTGSRKVQQCADAVMAVCDAYPRSAIMAGGGTVVVSGRTSPGQDFRAAVTLPEGQRIVTIGIDMGAPDGDVTAHTPAAPEVPRPMNTVPGITPPGRGIVNLLKNLRR